jgi:hypothetical protein
MQDGALTMTTRDDGGEQLQQQQGEARYENQDNAWMGQPARRDETTATRQGEATTTTTRWP